MPAERGRHGKPLQPCGTAAAYRRHLAYGEPTDPLCRAAWAEHGRNGTRSRGPYELRRQRARAAAVNALKQAHRAEYERLCLSFFNADGTTDRQQPV